MVGNLFLKENGDILKVFMKRQPERRPLSFQFKFSSTVVSSTFFLKFPGVLFLYVLLNVNSDLFFLLHFSLLSILLLSIVTFKSCCALISFLNSIKQTYE